jgi:hypothetical protein
MWTKWMPYIFNILTTSILCTQQIYMRRGALKQNILLFPCLFFSPFLEFPHALVLIYKLKNCIINKLQFGQNKEKHNRKFIPEISLDYLHH